MLNLGFEDKDLFKKISKGKYEAPSTMSEGAKSLIERILKINPEHRISASQVWFKNSA